MEKIKLKKEKREALIADLKSYFLQNDDEIGDLAAGLLLDFIIEKMAPEFYNQGIYDAYTYFSERIDDVLELQQYS